MIRLSERKGDDAVRIPIEIKSEDMAELQQLLQQLTEAEEAARTSRASGGALPSKGTAGAQTFGGQAKRSGREGAAGEGPGGIFAGVRDMDAMPTSFRDRTGRQAMQRESPFKALQDQVKKQADEQMENTIGLMDQMMQMGMGYVPFIGGAKIMGAVQKHGVNRLKQHMQKNAAQGAASPAFAAAGGAAGAMVPAGSGSKAFKVLSMVRNVSARGGAVGAIIAAVLTTIMLSKTYIDWTHSPGGPNDLRYRRVIATEMDPLFERKEKQEINMGIRTVRISGSPATRGETQIRSTLEQVRRGVPVYNGEFEAYAKGLFLGSGP